MLRWDKRNISVIAIGTAVISFGILSGMSANADMSKISIEGIKFSDHLSAGMIEQDVYVERTSNSDSVFRVSKDERETYKSSRLFSVKNYVSHAPFRQDAVGPYPKGKDLGITLEDWTAGSGIASYSCTDRQAQLKAKFRNLIPLGVYTLWNAYIGKQHMGCPNCPFSTIDFPIGATDGSQSVFVADKMGNATLNISMKSCLPLSNNKIATAFAIAYHSDGKTYGPNPGDFGHKTHVQLFAVLPDGDRKKTAQK